jgi:hypothetical protein
MHSLWVFLGLATATAMWVFVSGWPNQASPAKMMAATAGQEHSLGVAIPDVGRFIQIPGPNPILVTGDAGAWDGGVIEAGNVLKDQNT